ncbi:hypothetical protein [Frankia sp. AgB32]|uniref:hypothetical protein n=1 Tax=Frankia sp. AgB32 TaxID=631119 RepID=UPI00200FCA68|nr:hypothetical protein [Frankia sp. AgB32]MCK9895208.1 hypothetical protein [Frankia sp. AgB32]
MTAPTDVAVETTRIEITGGSVDAWALLVELAQAGGLDQAVPPRLAPDSAEITSVEVAGELWDGLTARLVVEPAAGGGLAATLTTTGGEAEDPADTTHLHGRVLNEAAVWLDERRVVWRWTSDRCAPESWHCGWRLTATHHPAPTVPVAAWRRWVALVVDWTGAIAGWALALAALVGAGVPVVGTGRLHGGLLDLVMAVSPPRIVLALGAAALLAREVSAVACYVLDPSEDAPRRWWVRVWQGVQDSAVTVLLAGAVIALGGGWLS